MKPLEALLNPDDSDTESDADDDKAPDGPNGKSDEPTITAVSTQRPARFCQRC
jgi:hypothetical protein